MPRVSVAACVLAKVQGGGGGGLEIGRCAGSTNGSMASPILLFKALPYRRKKNDKNTQLHVGWTRPMRGNIPAEGCQSPLAVAAPPVKQTVLTAAGSLQGSKNINIGGIRFVMSHESVEMVCGCWWKLVARAISLICK